VKTIIQNIINIWIYNNYVYKTDVNKNNLIKLYNNKGTFNSCLQHLPTAALLKHVIA